ncbi:hypothetical protein SAMN04487866_1266 [Thermoactinomyces sp. DSM 45891]|uniref:hypothetical protein n=1 Tax=Thermoactinomyces sp. DSM 45891 TaxID=1761907 RepID=UPI0009139779|nr:hypothetical protein [Thermoactinomyces sp. DSM 45891]SFX79152.1 hypothetical protein SAMN04487866_1266 [Thermoactinomyces sp. DSM 45891]
MSEQWITLETYNYVELEIKRDHLRVIMNRLGWKEEIEDYLDECTWDTNREIYDEVEDRCLEENIAFNVRYTHHPMVTRKKELDRDYNIVGELRGYYLVADEDLYLSDEDMEAIMDAIDELNDIGDNKIWDRDDYGQLLLVHPDSSDRYVWF